MRKEQVVKMARILLPVLFSLYLGGIISFTHVHIENGTTIVHSHPYQKGENGSTTHHHTGTELQLLSQISTVLITGFFGLFVFTPAQFAAFRSYTSRHLSAAYIRPVRGNTHRRAPPIV